MVVGEFQDNSGKNLDGGGFKRMLAEEASGEESERP